MTRVTKFRSLDKIKEAVGKVITHHCICDCPIFDKANKMKSYALVCSSVQTQRNINFGKKFACFIDAPRAEPAPVSQKSERSERSERYSRTLRLRDIKQARKLE